MARTPAKAPPAKEATITGNALDETFVRRVLVVVAVVGLIALVLKMAGVILMIFGAVLIAILLRSVADLLHRWAKLPMRLALFVSTLLLLAVISGGFALLWLEIESQLDRLPDTLPETLAAAERRILDLPFGDQLLARLRAYAQGAGLSDGVGEAAQGFARRLKNFLMSAGGFATNAVLVLAGGVYLSINPKGYRNGALLLIPRDHREQVSEALCETGRGLKYWLLGTGLDMIGVGLITGLGLWLVGIPSPVLLGVLAGLGVLVPIVGPTLAAIPGLLLAVAGGPTTFLLALGVYVGVQQIESNLIMPVIQRQITSLPPMVTLFSIAVFGLMFGPIGVLLAVPLAVTVYVMVRALYVRDILGEDIRPLDVGRS